MPEDKDFKRLVRRRMAQTGERYTTARLALERQADSFQPVASPDAALAKPVHSRNDVVTNSQEETMDELLNYATLGIRAQHVRDYRKVLPEISLEDLAGLWVMGVDPKKATLFAEAGLNREMMLKAAAVGISPEEAKEFQNLMVETESN